MENTASICCKYVHNEGISCAHNELKLWLQNVVAWEKLIFKNSVSWDVMPCSLVKYTKLYKDQIFTSSYPDDRGNTFTRNISKVLPE
jgi:hypothetical protein